MVYESYVIHNENAWLDNACSRYSLEMSACFSVFAGALDNGLNLINDPKPLSLRYQLTNVSWRNYFDAHIIIQRLNLIEVELVAPFICRVLQGLLAI